MRLLSPSFSEPILPVRPITITADEYDPLMISNEEISGGTMQVRDFVMVKNPSKEMIA